MRIEETIYKRDRLNLVNVWLRAFTSSYFSVLVFCVCLFPPNLRLPTHHGWSGTTARLRSRIRSLCRILIRKVAESCSRRRFYSRRLAWAANLLQNSTTLYYGIRPTCFRLVRLVPSHFRMPFYVSGVSRFHGRLRTGHITLHSREPFLLSKALSASILVFKPILKRIVIQIRVNILFASWFWKKYWRRANNPHQHISRLETHLGTNGPTI